MSTISFVGNRITNVNAISLYLHIICMAQPFAIFVSICKALRVMSLSIVVGLVSVVPLTDTQRNYCCFAFV